MVVRSKAGTSEHAGDDRGQPAANSRLRAGSQRSVTDKPFAETASQGGYDGHLAVSADNSLCSVESLSSMQG